VTSLVVDHPYVEAALYLVVRKLSPTCSLTICKTTIYLYTILLYILWLKENYYVINYLIKVDNETISRFWWSYIVERQKD
jgi:hypothetical protein